MTHTPEEKEELNKKKAGPVQEEHHQMIRFFIMNFCVPELLGELVNCIVYLYPFYHDLQTSNPTDLLSR